MGAPAEARPTEALPTVEAETGMLPTVEVTCPAGAVRPGDAVCPAGALPPVAAASPIAAVPVVEACPMGAVGWLTTTAPTEAEALGPTGKLCPVSPVELPAALARGSGTCLSQGR